MKLNFLNRNVIKIIVIFITLTYTSVSQTQASRENISDAVKYLSSDELKGRFPGTEGIESAATYIENHFKNLGLKNWNGSFRQEFFVTTGLEQGSENSMYFETIIQRPGIPKEKLPKAKQNWVINHDFVPLGFSDNGTASGEVAFVGFGISAPEINYDDYAGIDVKGKVVILISETPENEKKDSPFLPYSSLRYKATTARNKGAIGLIMVKIQGDSMNVFERLEYANIGKNSGIIAVQAWRQSVSKFFPKDKALIFLENSIVSSKKPNSFILPFTLVNFTVELKELKSPTYNLNAYIEGSDPSLKDEFIVIGAHYDHLGYGGPTSMKIGGGKPQIHNGADDNASGISGIIEIANMMKNNPPKRSIIFSAYSGEELGLLGSAHFVNNSPVDLKKIVTMINLDMIGRMKKNELTVFGTSSSNYFTGIIDSLDLIDTVAVTKASDAYGPSDHASFVTKEIPVLMFFTGLHEDYHKPSDDFEKINLDGMVWAVNYIYSVANTIANSNIKPDFKKTDMTQAPARNSEREHGYGEVWFGIIPNFEENPLGCKISGATPGSPADKAGLQNDDIIVKMDDVTIKNLYDFMYKVRAHKAGDVLHVTVLRGKDYKDKVEMDVTLVQKTK